MDTQHTVAVVVVTANDCGKRVDVILRYRYADLPLSAIYRLVRTGAVRVNNERVAINTRVRTGDRVAVDGARIYGAAPRLAQRTLQYYREQGGAVTEIDRRVGTICWQNEHIIALNKQRGAVLFGERRALGARPRTPAHLHRLSPPSCQEAVRRYIAADPAANWGIGFVPSALHRIDRNTSGIVCFSKSLAGARAFSKLLHNRQLRKEYLAVVRGRLRQRVVWRDQVGRIPTQRRAVVRGVADSSAADSEMIAVRDACTVVRPLLYGNGLTLIAATISTGRYHQIRVQAAAHHYPLFADRKYDRAAVQSRNGYFLHAHCIRNERYAAGAGEVAAASAADDASASEADSVGDASALAATLFDTLRCPLSTIQRQMLASLLGVRVDELRA